MLARYLRELSKPVRYASPYHDPASLQALMNFLAINTRALGLPMLHRNLTAPEWTGEGTLGSLYQQHPAMPHAAQSLFQTHHPGDLAAYLDMAAEAGLPHDAHDYDSRHVNFINELLGMHRELTEGGGVQGVNPRILRQYGHRGLSHRDVYEAVRQAMSTGDRSPAMNLTDLATALGRGDRQSAMHRHRDQVFLSGSPMGLVHLHDIADDVNRDPVLTHLRGHSERARTDIGNILRNTVQPTLRGL